MSTVEKINEDYLYWNKAKYLALPEGCTHETAWKVARFKRWVSATRIELGALKFGWNMTNQMQKQQHELDMHMGGFLRLGESLMLEDKGYHLNSSIMEEAIASSQIEGASTTRQQAKEMLRLERAPRTKSERMIVNNHQTIRRIQAIKNEPLTLRHLLDIHRLVTDGTLDDPADEGALRRSDDITVFDHNSQEVVYTPPTAAVLPAMIGELCHFFNTSDHGVFIHPIIKACILHFLIGYIHPFVDGNGRTARALFYWFLLREGYWLTEYLSISKTILKTRDSYSRAFLYTELDGNDLTYFIRYQLRVLNAAFDDLRQYLDRKREQKKQLSFYIRIPGINERQAQVLQWMHDDADLRLTVKTLHARLGTSFQTARTDLQKLADQGYLDIVAINRKTQSFMRGQRFAKLLRSGNRA